MHYLVLRVCVEVAESSTGVGRSCVLILYDSLFSLSVGKEFAVFLQTFYHVPLFFLTHLTIS